MPLLDLSPYAEMTPVERTHRIGVLLESALVRYHRRQRAWVAGIGNENQVTNDPAFLVNDEIEKGIVRRVARFREATPHDLQIALGLSPATASRKLARLRQAGILLASGKTSAVRYRIRGDPALN